ncbi:MAG: glycosyltransferase [Candidatus Competibacteraceae bacterium]|jgi:glycosyltransferase involved in cell wall biosynthesis|nr:glycosyltransferase [Candidatus Competibacteraceae bacterium]
MTRPIKVLQITRAAIDGGFDYHREISQAFAGNAFQVTTVFIRGSLPQDEIQRYQGEVVFLDARHRRQFKQRWIVALKLWLMSRREPFDLAICHHHKPAVAVNTLQKLWPIRRMYYVVHDYNYFSVDDIHGRRRRQFVLNRLDPQCKFIAVSNALRSNIQHWLPEFSAERCLVIPNAIDHVQLAAQSLERQAACQALGIDPTSFVFGTTGRLVSYKAHHELIDAYARVHESMPTSCLIIIGRGKQREKLTTQIKALGLEHKVKLIGFLPKAARYMAAFDVFVFPSHNEPFGLVLLEAMVNRLPILAADSGAVPEIIPHPDELFTTGDIAGLATKLVDFYRLPESARQALGQTGYQHLQRNFSLEHYRDCYRQLWEEPC